MEDRIGGSCGGGGIDLSCILVFVFTADAGHQRGQAFFISRAEEVIDRGDVALLDWHFQCDIEDERLQKVEFRIIPERILGGWYSSERYQQKFVP